MNQNQIRGARLFFSSLMLAALLPCALAFGADGPRSHEEICPGHPLAEWPAPAAKPAQALPLATPPYKSGAGAAWMTRINEWYKEGSAAGLTQDTFRSFDGGHSSIRMGAFPQLNSEPPVKTYTELCKDILIPRVTMGVQSFGVGKGAAFAIQGRSITEYNLQSAIRAHYTPGDTGKWISEDFYRVFYENNFLFCSPAVGTLTTERDSYSFLSPYYLHSIGKSGSDAILLTPLVCASAAMPPELKTRIMRSGLFVPVMMYLFKSHIAGGIETPEAHRPAYALPEAAGGPMSATPFLNAVVHAAHELEHVPPVARILFEKVEGASKEKTDIHPYCTGSPYAFAGVLRQGELFQLTLDLGKSWTDGDRKIARYVSKKLRGAGTLEPMNASGSRIRITVPWSLTPATHDFRSDFLLLVNDGTYDSAPAYVSIRHVQPREPVLRGIRVGEEK